MYVVLILLAIAMLFPYYYLVINAFKGTRGFAADPYSLIPKTFSVESILYAWNTGQISVYLRNSAMYATIVVVVQTFISSLAAYAFARIQFPGRDLLFLGILATMMLPYSVLLIPTYLIVWSLGLANTITGVVVPGFASAYGIPRRQRRKVVADVLELTDLKYKHDAFVDSLSRGMTQRLSLARVLVHDPPVLLLDEPASGLDPRARIEIRELLKELRRLGKTIMISSHILSELGEFCNKLGIIERGKLIVSGTVDDLMNRARAHPVISVRVLGNADLAEAALRDDPRIDRIERHGGSPELLVTLHDPNLHHGFLIERLVQRGIAIDSVHPEKLKLEDVFLRLTKGIVQ
jgi:ABC-type uncharacterized transport system ATPase subunit